ncbi:MAG: type II toxin-antitoxin system VapC family toxin [Nitrososphaerales archaeon]|nr:type II toxin-antitoxin system VapC family toxin [Nitrososphaerales archaeon]
MARKLALDSSVLVKWFKKGEEFELEALRLRDEVLSSAVSVFACELMHLEVCRGLSKAGYSEQKIDEAYVALREMSDFGFIRLVPVTDLKDKAKELIVKLNLYVADAISLAVAFTSHMDLLTEDRHLLKREVKESLKKEGLKTIRLEELHGSDLA